MVLSETAIIVGAGPAGLTAACELLENTNIKPIILEATDAIGGISQTAVYNGNRIDIGGHRFFSKSDVVMDWWQKILPLEQAQDAPAEKVMLVRSRKSRIYFLRRFFDYPISLTARTLLNLGFRRTVRITLSYLRSLVFKIRNVQNLEQFFINRFGRELYLTFFKSYTEKVWGVDCRDINAEWGIQRIKGLSILRAIRHFIINACTSFFVSGGIAQKNLETSLIEKFLYPKLGPGQLWEEVARLVQARGGEIRLHRKVTRVEHEGGRITAVFCTNTQTGQEERLEGAHFFSTMPVKDLIAAMGPSVPQAAREVARGLIYRDFLTVGLLARKMLIKDGPDQQNVTDNWIYIQEKEVKLGRLQIFNNWSPFLVKDPENTVWLGLEYFCSEGDEIWSRPDAEIIRFATGELASIGIIDQADVLDAVVLRMPKAYPAYFGSYDNFHVVRDYVDSFENLFLVGRNGMHRYNNQDHSMLTAIQAVANIQNGVKTKENIWKINTESSYHEEKQGDTVPDEVGIKVTAVENVVSAYIENEEKEGGPHEQH